MIEVKNKSLLQRLNEEYSKNDLLNNEVNSINNQNIKLSEILKYDGQKLYAFTSFGLSEKYD